MTPIHPYVLTSQYDQIVSGMNLRRPQIESLGTVQELLMQLPTSISDLDASEIAEKCRQLQPDWTFPSNYASLTYALATGVGKTRLIGAIAGYLFRTGQSRNFVILAPREAILRKFEQEVRQSDAKYIFVNSSLVPQPRVCHRGNILEFVPERNINDALLPSGPNIFIFSPQLLVTNSKISTPSEFTGESVKQYLETCGDLVVFVDESHHISSSERNETMRTWGGAITALKPKLVFEMTATPREGAALAYEYGLAQCLRERLYTKSVRLIVDENARILDDEEYDLYTIRFALARLEEKEKAIKQVQQRAAGFPSIKPILLIAAKNVAHANLVGEWLRNDFGFEENEILVIHSSKKTDADMQSLAAVENPASPVRVVVQVHILDEGWDVTNVYVIAPLRNVQSYVNAKQVMGRGLRLPAGHRIGHAEVDTLDVLAFGQETFQDIFEQAKRDFGPPDSPDGGVDVVRAGAQPTATQAGTKQPDDRGAIQTKVIPLPLVRPSSIEIPKLDFVPPEPVLDVNIGAGGIFEHTGSGLDLGTLKTTSVLGDLRIDRHRFVEIATDEVFKNFVYLSDPIHRMTIKQIIEGVLEKSGQGELVGVDPSLCAKFIAEHLEASHRKTPPTYEYLGASELISLTSAEANVPLTYSAPFVAEEVWTCGWSRAPHFRQPISGWQHCSHELAHFDSKPEFELAYKLDRMEEVNFWLRNEPGQLVIPTLAGDTKPDFVTWLNDGTVLLLEVKGDYLWEPGFSDSWVRARDVKLWVETARATGVIDIKFVLLLGAAIPHISNLIDIFNNDESGSSSQ